MNSPRGSGPENADASAQLRAAQEKTLRQLAKERGGQWRLTPDNAVLIRRKVRGRDQGETKFNSFIYRVLAISPDQRTVACGRAYGEDGITFERIDRVTDEFAIFRGIPPLDEKNRFEWRGLMHEEPVLGIQQIQRLRLAYLAAVAAVITMTMMMQKPETRDGRSQTQASQDAPKTTG